MTDLKQTAERISTERLEYLAKWSLYHGLPGQPIVPPDSYLEDPTEIRSILTELLASRHADAQPEPAEWQVEAACDAFGIAKTNWFDRGKMTNALHAASVSARGEQKRYLKDGPVLRLVRLRFFRDLIQSERVKVYETFGIDKSDLPDPLTLGIEQHVFDQLFVRRAASLPAPERSKEETGGVDRDSIRLLRQFADMYRSGAQGSQMGYDTAQALALSIDDVLSALETPPLHKEGEGSDPTEEMIAAGLRVDFDNEDERATVINVWHAMSAAAPSNPVVSDEMRAALNQCRLAFAGLVSVQSAVDMLDALSVNPQSGSES